MTIKQKISILTFFFIIMFNAHDSYSQSNWSITQFNEATTLHKKAVRLHKLYNEKSTKYRLSCKSRNDLNEY